MKKISLGDKFALFDEHCADEEACILCFEPADTLDTCNVRDAAYTAPRGVAI
jgi:hypothetical protein